MLKLDNSVSHYVRLLGVKIPTRRSYMQVTDSDWAGFFDGEGCVQPMKYFSKIHNEKFIVGMRAVVVQKEPEVLYLLQKQFGGAVQIRRNGIGQWQCGNAEQVTVFFKSIWP